MHKKTAGSAGREERGAVMSPAATRQRRTAGTAEGRRGEPVAVLAIAGSCSPEKKERDENAGVLGSRCRDSCCRILLGTSGSWQKTWEEQNGGS